VTSSNSPSDYADLRKISSGELGVEADRLEDRLSNIFQLAHHWNAVLLLDEADVYLETRIRQDLVRNGLVAVFLRTLEYCKGVLFLTSNRSGEIDAAVCSRVHVLMKYNNLEDWARRKVWESFLRRANTVSGPASISTKEFDSLVAVTSTGRQVRLKPFISKRSSLTNSITDQKPRQLSSRPGDRRGSSSELFSFPDRH
jgi:hypothetical protein